MENISAPQPQVWRCAKEHTSKDSDLKHIPGFKRFWKGFIVVEGDPSDPEYAVEHCSECAVFRGKRRSSKPCRCPGQRIKFPLSPDGRSADFEYYRDTLSKQLRTYQGFFRNRLVDVLRYYPGIRCEDFRLRISISAKGEKVRVELVEIERLDELLRNKNPWGKRINEWNNHIKWWNERYRRWNRSHSGDWYQYYAGIGMVIFEFEVCCPGTRVRFELQLELPLLESKLVGGGSIRAVDNIWAYQLADQLSDDPPNGGKFCDMLAAASYRDNICGVRGVTR